MEPIKMSRGENMVLSLEDTRQRIVKTMIGHAGIICSTLILFVAAIVLTTDISLTSVANLKELTKTLIILLTLNYMMFFSGADNGTNTGIKSEVYINSCNRYDELKKKLMQFPRDALSKFCKHFVETEQEAVRAEILIEVGLSVTDMNKCKGKNLKELEGEYTPLQIKAIRKALKVKAIKLKPDMICRRGRTSSRSHPLGTNPRISKLFKYAINIVRMTITTILTGAIIIETLTEFTWATVVELFIKLLPVVINGFNGYKLGLENKIITDVEYMSDQMDLMEQAIQYATAGA